MFPRPTPSSLGRGVGFGSHLHSHSSCLPCLTKPNLRFFFRRCWFCGSHFRAFGDANGTVITQSVFDRASSRLYLTFPSLVQIVVTSFDPCGVRRPTT
jgi:hypothetical protein